MISMSLHDVTGITANADENGGVFWVELSFNSKNDLLLQATLFTADMATAQAYAAAINSAEVVARINAALSQPVDIQGLHDGSPQA